MKSYMVYFTEQQAVKRKKLNEIIYGYNEGDALLRCGIKRNEITFIYEAHLP